MAKIKNKKRITADQIHKKRETAKANKKLNPFEIHVNREKLRVLGKKEKNDRGLPGVSRSKAIKKRKNTLLQEYKTQNKSNKFMDKRIGERNSGLTEEDRVIARFAAERVKKHSKKSIFNLEDDTVLMHRGQTITEMEQFEDPRSDDEESLDENRTGGLDADFTAAHFMDGTLTNTGKEGAKTHKQLIDQLIEESKKRKAEKQKIKEATMALKDKLDTEWKDLVEIVTNTSNKPHEEDGIPKRKLDDYDKTMRELRFEARGTVSDRLKTQDELAKEEKEKLEELEKERLERMKGFVESDKPNKITHRSADDLDDDFVYESDTEHTLTYDDEGRPNVAVEATINGIHVGEAHENMEEDQEQVQSEQQSASDESAEESESEPEDNLSDLKDSDSENDENIDKHTTKKVSTDNNSKPNSEEILTELLHRKEIMEEARKELPYTFNIPESYEDLLKTFENQSSVHQGVILERMIKCNHPSLSEGNKDSLGLLFAYLLQYLNDTFDETSESSVMRNNFEIFSNLVPHIYDLAQLNKESAQRSVIEVLKEKHLEYRKRPKRYPGYEMLVFLKMVSLIFPTSDFRHPLITPCFMFMEQMLGKCRVENKRDISYGLFLLTLILEYTELSKRYLPAAIRFLCGIFHMAIPNKGVKLVKILPPFKSLSSQLVLTSNYSKKNNNILAKEELKMSVEDLINTEISDLYKIKCFYTSVQVLNEFIDKYKELSCNVEIFGSVVVYLKQVTTQENYPKFVQNDVKETLDKLEKLRCERKLYYIVMEAAKPKALRLYEPKIVEVRVDGKRRKIQSAAKAERDKLLHKLKKETKGALREIRRDRSFLGRVKINQKIQSDKQRREKVNKLYSEAALQQNELNTMDRKNKKK